MNKTLGVECPVKVVDATPGLDQVIFVDLKLGQCYAVEMNVEDGQSKEPVWSHKFYFEAYPPCGANQLQRSLKCYWLTTRAVAYHEATEHCQSQGGSMAKMSSISDETALVRALLQMSAGSGKFFWVDSSHQATGSKSTTKSKNGFQRSARKCTAVSAAGEATAFNCTEVLYSVCERRLNATVAEVSDVNVSDMTHDSATVQWNVTGGPWLPATFTVSCKKAANDSDTEEHKQSDVADQTTYVRNLQPGVPYEVSVAAKLEDGTSGRERRVALQTSAQMEGDGKEGRPIKGEPARLTYSVIVIRIIGSSMVLLLVGMTVIVFLTCSVLTPDVVCQIFSELFLIGAYTCVLLTTTDPQRLGEKQCFGVAVALQYFFIAIFLFMMLEVMYMARLLTRFFPRVIPFSNITVMAAGTCVPAVITAVFAAAFPKHYTRDGQVCWCDLDQVVSYSTIFPVGLFASINFLYLALVFIIGSPVPKLSSEEIRRARVCQSSKWASAIILVTTTLSWSTGMLAEHRKRTGLYVTFSVSSVMLGVFVITLRIATDEQVRKKIMSRISTASREKETKVREWVRKSITSEDLSLTGTVSTVTTPFGSQQSLKIPHK